MPLSDSMARKGWCQVLAKLVQSGGMNAIARQLGAAPAAALAAARALMPGLTEGLRTYPGGISALLAKFADLGGDRLAAAVMGPDPVDSTPGQAIIARIGGIVVSQPDDAPGDQDLRLQLAPLLAMLVVGYLSARAAASGLTEEELAALLIADDKPGASDEEPV